MAFRFAGAGVTLIHFARFFGGQVLRQRLVEFQDQSSPVRAVAFRHQTLDLEWLNDADQNSFRTGNVILESAAGRPASSTSRQSDPGGSGLAAATKRTFPSRWRKFAAWDRFPVSSSVFGFLIVLRRRHWLGLLAPGRRRSDRRFAISERSARAFVDRRLVRLALPRGRPAAFTKRQYFAAAAALTFALNKTR